MITATLQSGQGFIYFWECLFAITLRMAVHNCSLLSALPLPLALSITILSPLVTPLMVVEGEITLLLIFVLLVAVILFVFYI